MARKKKRRARKKLTGKKGHPYSVKPKGQRLGLNDILARMPTKEFLTTKEVQHAFGVHEITVYKWIQGGKLKPYRVKARGRANLYKRVDVESFARERFNPIPVVRPGSDD